MKPITLISDWEDDFVEIRVFADNYLLCFNEDGFSCSPLTEKSRAMSIANHRKHTWLEVE